MTYLLLNTINFATSGICLSRRGKVWEQTICDGDELAGRGIALEY
jgi:hypothetical protein